MTPASLQTTTVAGVPRIPTVAIVGRPNVGKSALFNRLAGRRIALVEDLPGTTRDRLVAEIDWHGRALRLVDTGGLESTALGVYSQLIRDQIDAALREADVIVFVVDGRDGLTSEDYEVADLLRRARQPVILVANKVDNERRERETVQFFELGMGAAELVSAFHGQGVSDMLDAVLDRLAETTEVAAAIDGPAIAIIGRPNVGKSMLLNALLGEERVIVSDVPGTTRDAIDTHLRFEGRDLTLIDTAGIRRRGHIVPGIERHSVLRAESAIERCDVALALMDATEPVTAQDTHILQLVDEAAKGLVLVLNKTDLLVDPGAQRDLLRYVRRRLRFLPWAPIVLISALKRVGLPLVLGQAMKAAAARDQRVATGPLNTLLQRAIVRHPPRSVQGRRLKLLYATQASVRPPTFVLFVNDRTLVHFAYERYVENRLREAYGFEGTVIRILFKTRAAEPINDSNGPAESAAREPAHSDAGAGAGTAKRSRRRGE